MEKNHLPFKKIDLDELKNVEGSISSTEENINIFKIKKIIVKKIAKNKNINLKLNETLSNKDLSKYTKVIIATYENNNFVLEKLELKLRKNINLSWLKKPL